MNSTKKRRRRMRSSYRWTRNHCRDVTLSVDAFPQRWLRAWIPSRRRSPGASVTTPLRLSVL